MANRAVGPWPATKSEADVPSCPMCGAVRAELNREREAARFERASARETLELLMAERANLTIQRAQLESDRAALAAEQQVIQNGFDYGN